MFFQQQLIAWYNQNKRELPWRETLNPYFIWLSEVILQQTRVKQGLPYYLKFTEKYPTLQDLAQAPQDDVLRLWQGLGYYSRARNMHKTAQSIIEEHNGIFPDNYQKLITLKGIGDYTASAIASFAFQEAVAVLDGNVFRVLARFFGNSEDIATPKGVKAFRALSKKMLPTENSHTYNQAIMEFGAMLCSPQKPNCMYCPLQAECVAFSKNLQSELPVKTKKTVTKQRFFHYFVFVHEHTFLMRKRPETDIWAGLYDFYLQELNQDAFETPEIFTESAFLRDLSPYITLSSDFSATPTLKHKLTHQTISIKFIKIEVDKKTDFLKKIPNEYAFYDCDAVLELPKPIVIANYVKTTPKLR